MVRVSDFATGSGGSTAPVAAGWGAIEEERVRATTTETTTPTARATSRRRE
jgi:hypothetical protein